MITVVLIGLAAAAVLLTILGGAVVWHGAFRGDSEPAAGGGLAWRPAFIHGEALRNWAAFRTEEMTRAELASSPRRDAALRVVSAVENAADQAMLPLARPAERERIVACPAHGQGIAAVNAAEVISIAEHLRRQSSRGELQRIHAVAAENARHLADESGRGHLAAVHCPLQGTDHVCRAFGVRPLRCRPLHAATVAAGMGERSVRFPAGRTDAAAESHELTIARGIEMGFTRALQSAGLDATVYELNSALARALETPDAAERWARGEAIFAGCRTA